MGTLNFLRSLLGGECPEAGGLLDSVISLNLLSGKRSLAYLIHGHSLQPHVNTGNLLKVNTCDKRIDYFLPGSKSFQHGKQMWVAFPELWALHKTS